MKNLLRKRKEGFTLIETLVAVTPLSVAIVAPMSLTAKSLATAYYARDQITAFHLAQEAIESIRHARDHNILLTALGTPTDLLDGVPSTNGSPFTIDTIDDSMDLCPSEDCPPLRSNGSFYGYGGGSGWEDTRFTRSVEAEFVGGSTDEVRIVVTVSWQTGAFQARSISISENLYRWLNDGT